VPGQIPPTQPPTQPPSNSYTIDIASASYNLVPETRAVPPTQPNYNAYSAPPPVSSPLPFASPSVNSPPSSNYVYQAPPVGGAPPPAFSGVPPPTAGLGINYPPQTMDTTPRFSVPLPSNMTPPAEMPKMGYVPGMSPPPQSVSPFSPPSGYNMGYSNPSATAPINPLPPTIPPAVQPNAYYGNPPPAW